MSVKVLIVDDSAMMRRLVRFSIEHTLGWRHCVEAESGHIAVERAREISPDAAIVDWQMPGMNGIETAREISRISPKTAMALFTLHEKGLIVKDAQAAGIQRIFSKTESMGALLDWLRIIGKDSPVVGA